MQLRYPRAAVSQDEAAPVVAGGGQVRSGLLLGILSGLTAIMCCVSPVVLVLLGVATAAQAVTLGDTLYYDYGWWFRGGGLGVASVAVILHLRRRKSCSVQGAKGHRRMFLTLLLSGGATYAGLCWFTKMLAVWFG
ncbi:MAG: hypothetical protein V3S37_03625 [Dehalococcoidia bacterium]